MRLTYHDPASPKALIEAIEDQGYEVVSASSGEAVR